MAVWYAGIDEAGYGPRLGPLAVGLCVLRVPQPNPQPNPGEPDPRQPDPFNPACCWSLLKSAVCREAAGARGKRPRIPMGDSKKLKGSNQAKKAHPLTHLERAVLALLWCCDPEHAISTDADLFAVLGCGEHAYATDHPAPATHPCYAGAGPAAFPSGLGAQEARLAANQLALAMSRAGARAVMLRCGVLAEAAYNAVAAEAGTKAATTSLLIQRHLREVTGAFAAGRAPDDTLLICCDRQSGRTRYAALLRAALSNEDQITDQIEPQIEAIEESPERSRYRVRCVHAGVPLSFHAEFRTESEERHLPVAAASMTAKLVRELAMARFNAYFSSRCPTLRPTAGYAQDAARWLRDAGAAGVLSPADRRALVRVV